jgi:anti-anti-sigma factor
MPPASLAAVWQASIRGVPEACCMTLRPGTRFGPYDVAAEIGAGRARLCSKRRSRSGSAATARATVNMKLRTHGRRAVLTVHDPWNQSGRIEGLEEKVDDLLQRGFTGLVLQCEGVTQIDSRGLGQLVQVNAAIMRRGGHLQIVGLTRPLNDLLSVVRLTGGSPDGDLP